MKNNLNLITIFLFLIALSIITGVVSAADKVYSNVGQKSGMGGGSGGGSGGGMGGGSGGGMGGGSGGGMGGGSGGGMGGGHSCIECHDVGGMGGMAPKIDVGVMRNSAHKDLNGGLTDINNVCYACHGNGTAPVSKHPAEYKTPKDCDQCHTGTGEYDAPLIIEHNQVGDDIITNSANCKSCHYNTGMYLTAGIGTNVHYIKNVTGISTTPYGHFGPINTSNCKECHLGSIAGSTKWGNPADISKSPKYAHTFTETGECQMCHSDGSAELVSLDFHDKSLQGAAGGACITCHTSNPSARFYVDTSLFGKHADLNKTDGLGNVTDADCITCHYVQHPDMPMALGAANSGNTYFCVNCHTTTGGGPVKPTTSKLLKNTLQHATADCKWCHIAGDTLSRPLSKELRYHPNGPSGTAKNKTCITCHWDANLQDLPFHAPGVFHEKNSCGIACHSIGQDNNHVVYWGIHDPGNIVNILNLTTNVDSVNKKLSIQFDVSYPAPKNVKPMQIAAAQYNITTETGVLVVDWTNMTAKDGRYNSYIETVNANISALARGNYTVNVKGMASGPRLDLTKQYYPFNGLWSNVFSQTIIV